MSPGCIQSLETATRKSAQEAFDQLPEEEKEDFRLICNPEDAVQVCEEEAQTALAKWAEEAFQLRGEQSDYDRVMASDDQQAELEAIRDEIIASQQATEVPPVVHEGIDTV